MGKRCQSENQTDLYVNRNLINCILCADLFSKFRDFLLDFFLIFGNMNTYKLMDFYMRGKQMKKKIYTILIGIIVLMVTVSCSLLDKITGKDTKELSSTPVYIVVTSTSAPSPVATEPSYLLKDDFSNPQSGWELYSGDYGTVAYEQGGYVVTAIEEGEYNWGVAGENFDDVRIDVDATVLKTVEAGNDAFGVDCRIQENGDGYGFRITSDGFVAISKYENMESSALIDWFESETVYTDGRTNHITAICNGSNLQFIVNGVSVARAEDETFPSGDIALSAVGFETGEVSVLFDNILVQRP